MGKTDKQFNQHQRVREARAKVIQKARLEQFEQSKGVIQKLLESGAKAAERNEVLFDTFYKGVENYRANLFQQALRLSNQEKQNNLFKAFGNPGNFAKIEISNIIKLKEKGQITNSQALALCQISTLNSILQQLDIYNDKGYKTTSHLFNAFKLFNGFDHTQAFFVEVGVEDECSLALFQDANQQAYSGFTSTMWQELVVKNDLAEGLRDAIKLVMDVIKDASSDLDAIDDNDEIMAFCKDFLHTAVEHIADNDSGIQNKLTEIFECVLPAFLGVKITDNEMKKIKSQICGLIDREGIDGFELDVSFFNERLDACFPTPEQEEDKNKIRAEIETYIDNVRQYKLERQQSSLDDFTQQNKEQRKNLREIVAKIEEQRKNELEVHLALSDTERKKIVEFLSKVAPKMAQKIRDLIDDHEEIPLEVVSLLKPIITKRRAEDAANILGKELIERLMKTDNHRVKFYNTLLKQAKNELRESEVSVISKINLVKEHIQSLLSISSDINFTVSNDDNYALYFSRIVNPTEFAVSKYMPTNSAERLIYINRVIITYKQVKDLRDKLNANEDCRASKGITKSLAKLDKALQDLEAHKNKLERNSLLLTIGTVEEELKRKLNDHKNANIQKRDKFFFNISQDEFDLRIAKDQQRAKPLINKINELKSYLKETQQVDDADKLRVINELHDEVKKLEKNKTVSNPDFDSGVLKDELERIASFYSQDASLKAQSIKRDFNKTNLVRKEGFVNGWVDYIKRGTYIAKIVHKIWSMIKSVFVFIFNVITFTPSKTWKFFRRKIGDTKKLVVKNNQLIADIQEVLGNNCLSRFEKASLTRLLDDAKALDEKIGRFSYRYAEVHDDDGYRGLVSRLEVLKTKMSANAGNLSQQESGSKLENTSISRSASRYISHSGISHRRGLSSDPSSSDSEDIDCDVNILSGLKKLDPTSDNFNNKLLEAVHADFISHIPIIIADREKLVDDALKAVAPVLVNAPEIYQNASDLKQCLTAEIINYKASLTASLNARELKILTKDDLLKLDNMLEKYNALSERITRQSSTYTSGQMAVIVAKKALDVLHKDPVISESIREILDVAVTLVGEPDADVIQVLGQVGSSIAKIVITNELQETHRETLSSLTEQEKAEQIAAEAKNMKPLQITVIIARRLATALMADPDVQSAVYSAIDNGSAAIHSKDNINKAVIEAFTAGVERFVQGDSLVITPTQRAEDNHVLTMFGMLVKHRDALSVALSSAVNAIAHGEDATTVVANALHDGIDASRSVRGPITAAASFALAATVAVRDVAKKQAEAHKKGKTLGKCALGRTAWIGFMGALSEKDPALAAGVAAGVTVVGPLAGGVGLYKAATGAVSRKFRKKTDGKQGESQIRPQQAVSHLATTMYPNPASGSVDASAVQIIPEARSMPNSRP